MISEHAFSTITGMSLALDELSSDIIFLISGVVKFLKQKFILIAIKSQNCSLFLSKI